MRHIAIALFFALVVIAMAVSGTRDDAIPDSKYIEYGKTFAPYTVKVVSTSTGSTPSWGTATLIGDHWAATAAHVVHDAVEVEIEGKKSRQVFVHPEFEQDCLGCFDIALMRFDDSFDRDFYPSLSTGEENVGDTVSIVGYGVCGPMSTGYDSSDDILRAGTARIDRFDGSRIICPISRGSSPMPFGIAPGDSGGPMFCGGKLAGVNSFTMRDKGHTLKSKAGEEQGFARVSVMREWMDTVMGVEK